MRGVSFRMRTIATSWYGVARNARSPLPTGDLVEAAVRIGNSHGPDVDKFEDFGLTAAQATKVGAPLIAECYASYACKLVDTSLIRCYSLFVSEGMKAAQVATLPRYPTTVHYCGDGVFLASGHNVTSRRAFEPEDL